MVTLFERLQQPTLMHDSLELSIQENLALLLNTRQGSLVYLPDYGLPDLYSYYAGLPQSISQLMSDIQQAIENYEPRLHDIWLESFQQLQQPNHVLELVIHACLSNQQPVQFKTVCLASGQLSIFSDSTTL